MFSSARIWRGERKRIESKFIASTFSLLALLSALCFSSLQAQQEEPLDAEFEMPVPIRTVQEISFKTSAFTFVRIKYSNRLGPGSTGAAWLTDFPDADRALSNQVERSTGLTIDPDGLQLELTDPALQDYPFIYIVEAGQMRLSDDEAVALRNYLLGGGFLMADDFWGEYEWGLFAEELHRVFPDREPVELTVDHEIFQSFYYVSETPQVPGRGGARPGTQDRLLGLLDDNGRLMAILCHNHDFGDAWEHLNDPWYPKEISLGHAVPMGVNIVVYALSR